VRLGLNYVRGLGEDGARRIVAARPFADLADCCQRTRLPRRLVEHLILAGAFDGWGQARRVLLWELGMLRYEVEELELPVPSAAVDLPALEADEAHGLEMATLGLSTEAHPLARWRTALTAHGYVSSYDLSRAAGRFVRVVGTLVIHQAPPTAKGFHFLTLEDEFGMINVIVQPGIATRDRQAMRGGMVQVEGTVQREGDVVNLVAGRVMALQQAVIE
jgi:error-prone DNA polymerase